MLPCVNVWTGSSSAEVRPLLAEAKDDSEDEVGASRSQLQQGGLVTLRILRPADVCAALGISRSTLWKWRKEGRLPAPKLLGPNSIGWEERLLQAHLRDLPTRNLAGAERVHSNTAEE